eukprot:scpid59363/ scgid3256/ 
MTPTEAPREKNSERIRGTLYRDDEKSPPSRFTKFQIGDSVRLAKQKQQFEKGYTQNWTETVFDRMNILPTNPTTYTDKNLAGEPVDSSFYEQELQKTTRVIYRTKKVTRKDNKKRMQCK